MIFRFNNTLTKPTNVSLVDHHTLLDGPCSLSRLLPPHTLPSLLCLQDCGSRGQEADSWPVWGVPTTVQKPQRWGRNKQQCESSQERFMAGACYPVFGHHTSVTAAATAYSETATLITASKLSTVEILFPIISNGHTVTAIYFTRMSFFDY